MTSASFHHAFQVAGDHPCLPGHFPGSPLVPGVLLLEHVANALRLWRGERLARIVEAKFVAPLLPQQVAEVVLTDVNGRVRFEIRRDDVAIARGTVEGAA